MKKVITCIAVAIGFSVDMSCGMFVSVSCREATEEERGVSLYWDGRRTEAVTLLRRVVDAAGEREAPVAAAYLLGECFRLGDGVECDISLAAHYYDLALNSSKGSFIAAANEKNLAAYKLGSMYLTGKIDGNLAEGVEILDQACECVDHREPVSEAAVMLGDYYYDQNDFEHAKEYYGIVYRHRFFPCCFRHLGIDEWPNLARYSDLPSPSDAWLPLRFQSLSETEGVTVEGLVKAVCRSYLISPKFSERFAEDPYELALYLACSNVFDILGKDHPLQAIRSNLLLQLAVVRDIGYYITYERRMQDGSYKDGSRLVKTLDDEGVKHRENLLRDAADLGNREAVLELLKQFLMLLPENEETDIREIKEWLLHIRTLGYEVSPLVDELKREKEKSEGRMIRTFQILDMLSVLDLSFEGEKGQYEDRIFTDKVWNDLVRGAYDSVKRMGETNHQIDLVRKAVQGRYRALIKSVKDVEEKQRSASGLKAYVSTPFGNISIDGSYFERLGAIKKATCSFSELELENFSEIWRDRKQREEQEVYSVKKLWIDSVVNEIVRLLSGKKALEDNFDIEEIMCSVWVN